MLLEWGAGFVGSAAEPFLVVVPVAVMVLLIRHSGRRAGLQVLAHWKSRYDGLGRRIEHALPGNQAESFVYDVAGNLIRQTNFNGAAITNQYDLLNRLTNRSSVSGYKASFAYSLTGQRTNMVDAGGVTGYVYDNSDRLTNKVVSLNNGPTVTLTYNYDVSGSLSNIRSSATGRAMIRFKYLRRSYDYVFWQTSPCTQN